MDALENILNRVSAKTLAEPFPSKDEMEEDELKKLDDEIG